MGGDPKSRERIHKPYPRNPGPGIRHRWYVYDCEEPEDGRPRTEDGGWRIEDRELRIENQKNHHVTISPCHQSPVPSTQPPDPIPNTQHPTPNLKIVAFLFGGLKISCTFAPSKMRERVFEGIIKEILGNLIN